MGRIITTSGLTKRAGLPDRNIDNTAGGTNADTVTPPSTDVVYDIGVVAAAAEPAASDAADAVTAMGALGDANPLNHAKYTDAEAKTAAVLAGAITDDETKAPTHDAVYEALATKLTDLVDDTSPTLGGDLDADGKDFKNILLAEFYEIYDATSDISEGALTINWETHGNYQKVTLPSDVTITFTDPSGSCTLHLLIIEDGTGGWTPTFSSVDYWHNSTLPAVDETHDARNWLTFVYDAGADKYDGGCSNFGAVE